MSYVECGKEILSWLQMEECDSNIIVGLLKMINANTSQWPQLKAALLHCIPSVNSAIDCPIVVSVCENK